MEAIAIHKFARGSAQKARLVVDQIRGLHVEKALEILNLIDNITEESLSVVFIKLSADQQFQLLTELDLGVNRFNKTQRQSFKMLKQFICFGYYTSEVGATQELRYDAVPGGFKGSIPYKSSDPSWATTGLFN